MDPITYITDQSLNEIPILYATGNQVISGEKDFTIRPTVSGSIVLVSGDSMLKARLLEYNSDTFEASADDIEGFFVAKTFNYSDGHIGIEFYHPDGTKLGYSILGNRYGDGFVQSLSNTFRIEKQFGDLAYIQSAGLKDKFGRAFLLPTKEGTIALVSDINASASGFVYITGFQNISGLKDFTIRPTVNGTGVLLSGEAASLPETIVYTTGNQNISGTKRFLDQVYIKDLYVTGTQTIVNTTNTNVASNYLLLNATGGARDAGIFIVTGLSSGASGVPLTGSNNIGAVIGYDVPANRWVFGNTSRDSDLSQLEKIAGITDITNYSGFVNSNFYTRNNPSGFITSHSVVFTTGDQIINGIKNFTGIGNYGSRALQYNGTGVMIDGDAIPVQKYIRLAPFTTGAYNPYYIISGAAYLSASSFIDTNGNILLPQNPKNNTICEITIPNTNAGLSFNIFTVPASYPLNPFVFVSGGNGSAGYIKLSYIDGEWRQYPAVTPHKSTHSSYGADPLFAKDVLAVPEISNYYTNKLDADISVAGSGIYETNSQLNGKSYWTLPVGAAIPTFGIRWNNINNSWQIGLLPGFSIIFVQSFHNVPEPYMATGWQTVNYGATVKSIRRLPYVDITNQQIQGNLLIDNVFANNLVYNTGDQAISGLKNFVTRPQVNGTGVLLSGEAASLPSTIVYTTGDQTISGLKNFTTRPTVNTVPVALSGEASSNIEQWVKNDYGATLYKAQPVYVSGSNGNNILIHPASNSGEGTSSKTFGLLKQTLLNNEQGYVVTEGPLLNVDTSMAVEGDPVWLGPTGNLIYGLANKPKAPQHLVYLGFVERAHQNQGKIFVKLQNGFEIEELHDVRIINPQNNDIIIYNTSSGLWLNSGINFNNFYTKNNPSGFITGIDLSNYATTSNLELTGQNLQLQLNNKANLTNIYNAAVEWTTNHTLVDGTRYLAGDLVYVSGKIYKANFDNESIPVTSALYWTDLGAGYRLNIDGRDIPNIPVSTAIQAALDGKYSISNPSGFITGIDLSPYVTKSNGQFNDRPTVNGTGILLSGEVVSLPDTIVYTTGDQIISGKKSFINVNDPVIAKFEGYGSSLEIVNSDESLSAGYGSLGYAIGVGSNGFAIKYSSSIPDWGQPILLSEGGDLVVNTIPQIIFNQPVFAPNLVYTTSDQTISGNKTFSQSQITITGGSLNLGSIIDIGAPVTITQTHNTDTQVIDYIEGDVAMTRGRNGGLYNPNTEGSWNGDGPTYTEWNNEGWANLTNIKTRSYTNFYNANSGAIGNNVLNYDFVMHDTQNDKYYKIVFYSWTQGGASASHYAGFSYQRELINVVPSNLNGTNIGGNLDLKNRPSVNGTGVLLIGEAGQVPETVVQTSGSQIISGSKTFTAPTTFNNIQARNIQANSTGIFSDMQISADEMNVSGLDITISSGNLVLSSPTGIPATAGSSGIKGSFVWDTGHLYICTNTNSWKRVALTAW